MDRYGAADDLSDFVLSRSEGNTSLLVWTGLE